MQGCYSVGRTLLTQHGNILSKINHINIALNLWEIGI